MCWTIQQIMTIYCCTVSDDTIWHNLVGTGKDNILKQNNAYIPKVDRELTTAQCLGKQHCSVYNSISPLWGIELADNIL